MAEPVVIETSGAAPSGMNPKTVLIIIAAIVIVVLLLFLYFYEQGKSNSGAPSIATLPYDNTPGQTPGGTPGQSATQQQLTTIAGQINQAVTSNSGLGVFSTADNTTGLVAASNLSNTDLVALNNTYNLLFYSTGGGSFLQDIQGLNSFWSASDMQTLAAALATRIQSLTQQTE